MLDFVFQEARSRDAMIFEELRFQNSPKSPHIHARLYCDANEKSLPWKGLFLNAFSRLPWKRFTLALFVNLVARAFPVPPNFKGKTLGTSLPRYMGFPPESLLALSSQLRSLMIYIGVLRFVPPVLPLFGLRPGITAVAGVSKNGRRISSVKLLPSSRVCGS